MPDAAHPETCAWCARAVEPHDGFRAVEAPGARRAAFCRLEHVVPWAIQGPHWEPGDPDEAAAGRLPGDDRSKSCARCGETLGDVHVLLIRHRGEHRIPDAFCSAEHMAEWAKSGGRWGQA